MPHNITINSAEIRAIEKALRNVDFSDSDRMTAIQCCKSCDIQACPGSGKTTLLVAKLAVLAQKWRWKDRGILVLSHTNVARQEVQSKLARIGGHKLLEYPHFVGTIQKFAHQFLALPYLRSKGIATPRVDSSLSSRRIEERYIKHYGWSRELRSELHKNPSLKRKLCQLQYYFDDSTMRIVSREGPLPIETRDTQESNTFRLSKEQLRDVYKAKNTVAQDDGIFCYDDMYALALSYLQKHGWIKAALRYRFPWVLLDEMQDTDEIQDRLMAEVFGMRCILQRIGDTNQAIFGSRSSSKETGSSFPANNALQLPGSLRYCQQIADLAKPLTKAVDYQDLQGNSTVKSRTHTIFTFDQSSIAEVLPAFGRLLEVEYGQNRPKRFRAKALGARKTGSRTKDEHFPYCISEYYLDFNVNISSTKPEFRSLLECSRNARASSEKSGDFRGSWELLIDGILELLRRQGVFAPCSEEETRRRYSRTSLLEAISQAGRERKLRCQLYELLKREADTAIEKAQWESFCTDLRTLLGDCLAIEDWNEEALDYCAWPEAVPEVKETGNKANVYLHRTSTEIADIEIELSTIHMAKGETHTATLVLDTFEKAHDLKKILPFLVGSQKQPTDSERRRMKRTFVAMTRPRELLCLAMRRDHIDEAQRKKLVERGWKIKDL